MAKLENIIKIFPRTTNVDLVCESDSKHTMRKYFHIEIRPPHLMYDDETIIVKGLDESYANVTNMKICQVCWAEWMRSLVDVQKEFVSV